MGRPQALEEVTLHQVAPLGLDGKQSVVQHADRRRSRPTRAVQLNVGRDGEPEPKRGDHAVAPELESHADIGFAIIVGAQ